MIAHYRKTTMEKKHHMHDKIRTNLVLKQKISTFYLYFDVLCNVILNAFFFNNSSVILSPFPPCLSPRPWTFNRNIVFLADEIQFLLFCSRNVVGCTVKYGNFYWQVSH